MLDSIYHMTLKLKNRIFGVKTSRFCHLLRNVLMDVIMLSYLICTSGLSILLHGIKTPSDVTSCDKMFYPMPCSFFGVKFQQFFPNVSYTYIRYKNISVNQLLKYANTLHACQAAG